MKVKLYRDISGIGKRGETITVEGLVGEALNAAGECEVIQHDPPKRNAAKSTLKELPADVKEKLEAQNGNA